MAELRTELEVMKQLEKEYKLYRYTNDVSVLHNECYERIKILEWFIKKREL